MNAMLNDTSNLFFNDTSEFVTAGVWSDDLKSLYLNEMFTNWHFVNMVFTLLLMLESFGVFFF